MRYQQAVWEPVTERAGLSDLQWRDLRRTYATRMIEGGAPVFDVQQLLGHSNTKQTMTYCVAQVAQLSASVMRLYLRRKKSPDRSQGSFLLGFGCTCKRLGTTPL